MTVGIYIHNTAQTVQPADIAGHKRTDAAGQNVNDGVLDAVLFDVLAAAFQRGHIIPDGLGRAQVGDLDMEAPGVMTGIFKGLCILTGDMVFQLRVVLMVLGKLIHEGLITAVGTGDTLGADDKYMFHIST